MLAILVAFSRIPSNDSWVVTSIVVLSLFLPSNDVFVVNRRPVFGAVKLLDSSLSLLPRHPLLTPLSSNVCCVGVSDTLRLHLLRQLRHTL